MRITIPKDDGSKTLYNLIKEQHPDNLIWRGWDDYVDITNVWTNNIFFKELYWIRHDNNITITNDWSVDEIWINEIHLYTFWTISDLYILSEWQDWILEVRISKKIQ